MALQQSDVEKIAHLARLQLEESSVEGYVRNLSNILALVDQMQAVNTDNVEPLANPLDAVQRLRPDAVTEENQRDKLQANAPAQERGLFLVPKVIE
ncbi:glutamyl-tRNA amidotransferase [Pokkaliibacter plantistimulans]|uniref:Aspartyl/glutamyl-tRNA(Asn/Gln) amidotransferase subunit C n=2 Tax=Pseudomonadota TaxID=1224 RepID=A0ABX5LYE1_9GAMM|nr:MULTISPECIES: Asp-tRNA(Asn)/Glu-tRNA(Gln) amidotransferase subunit GatC [Pokkaliibacter]MDH2431686.1 Asp-tRNA(Asn)/Glu-tRNA(Gln) amidotransferase subunit GatC [Pokkaliibacter sp. MBI-7]PPC74752.1 Asp-tRNA(Asn)/Glu-tRNA(Gln) amidotransferase GatCAB subunit C [Pokkaliibacter plantistimulans]PXF31706.1 glutamyl-tRNA amidotransferase [Pokkaliibacter plantistimulans]